MNFGSPYDRVWVGNNQILLFCPFLFTVDFKALWLGPGQAPSLKRNIKSPTIFFTHLVLFYKCIFVKFQNVLLQQIEFLQNRLANSGKCNLIQCTGISCIIPHYRTLLDHSRIFRFDKILSYPYSMLLYECRIYIVGVYNSARLALHCLGLGCLDLALMYMPFYQTHR